MQKMRRIFPSVFLLFGSALLVACAGSSAGSKPDAGTAAAPAAVASGYDLIVRHGTVYDGTGAAPRRADVGIRADRVAFVGDLAAAVATTEIDATGKAVAPGFINVLSWANTALLVDGRGMSDLKQGVTLEIFGEGESGGPLNERMREQIAQ
ncbi:MAG: hypothetical protein ACR2I8_04875, partial [Steroidobacteraceae bacterium]